jgi:hypothetical protein
MKTSLAIKALLGAGALALPLLAFAESNVQTGAATATPGATAHLDFSIVIPKILYLRVGTGSTYLTGALTSTATVDLITFTPAAGTVGNGTAVAGTGGDLNGGVVTAAIVSNSGAVTLNATTTGAIGDGTGDSIPWSQITTTAAANTTGTFLPAPALPLTGTGANVLIPVPASKLIVQDAKWTYSYANAANLPFGTYGGVNVNNSRVTYTATMP